ncbi:hypothetical protein B7486_03640 [cyanobacterium TDX16]|nr:hypothetical protein B7486_03640 [cyanobacterium TDX16]
MSSRPLTVLIIGTLPPPIGGAAVSLQHLIGTLSERKDFRVIAVNTGRVRGHPITGPFRFLWIAWRVFWGACRADVVSLQPVPSGLPFIGPVVWGSVQLWRRPFMIRMFGGHDFLGVGGIRGWIVRFIVRSTDLYLAQTKALVASANSDRLRRVEWYPTNRPMAPGGLPPLDPAKVCRRFVFLSHVKPSKGIGELVQAAEQLKGEVQVDVYGPLLDGTTEAYFDGLRRVRYCGKIKPGAADELLPKYDALLLPTYWVGEGYPGIILEAFGAGLPVITTKWKAIPEIVDDTCGILVEPKSVDELQSAMQKLIDDADLFRRLCNGVRARREFYSTSRWVDEFARFCRELADGERQVTNR